MNIKEYLRKLKEILFVILGHQKAKNIVKTAANDRQAEIRYWEPDATISKLISLTLFAPTHT